LILNRPGFPEPAEDDLKTELSRRIPWLRLQ
jgi:hypothetical protein